MKNNRIYQIICLLFLGLSCYSQQSNKGIEIRTDSLGFPVSQEYFISSHDKKVNLYIREIGEGEPIIVLHGGFGNDHTNVIKVANGFKKNFRFIFYDQRGSTLSYCDKEDISVANHLEDLETIRRKLDINNFTLVSHSAGTVLALSYLQKFPERVNNLILLGAMDPKNGNLDYFTKEEQETWDIAAKQKEKFNSRPEIDAQLESLGLNKKNKTPNELQLYNHIKYYAAQNIYDIKKWPELKIPHWNPIAAKAASESFNWEYNFVNLLDSIKIPISVINGEYDFVVGAKGSPIWRNIIENDAQDLNLYIVENAGHLAWIDDPQKFYQFFKKALENN